MKHKKHWYKIYDGECPVCGRDQSYRERMYTTRPKNRKNRMVYISYNASYCGCMR